MKFPLQFFSVSRLRFLPLLGAIALFGAESARSAVIDLFLESPQILNLDSNARYVSETASLASSPFTSRFVSLYGGEQNLAVSSESSDITYSFALSSATVGQFSLNYTPDKGQTVDLAGNGETGILFHFENIQLKSPVGIMVGYYSTQWKGSAMATLSGTLESEDVFLPFSAFPSKTGDFSKVVSLSITGKNMQPGDSLSLGAITTVPEVSSPALLGIAAAMLFGRRRR